MWRIGRVPGYVSPSSSMHWLPRVPCGRWGHAQLKLLFSCGLMTCGSSRMTPGSARRCWIASGRASRCTACMRPAAQRRRPRRPAWPLALPPRALALRVVTSAEDDLSITDAQRLVSTVLDRRIDGDGVAVSGLPLPEVIDLGRSMATASHTLQRPATWDGRAEPSRTIPSGSDLVCWRPRRGRTRRGWPCCSRLRSTGPAGSLDGS